MKNNKKQTITILLAIVPVLFVVSLAIILKHNQPKEYVPIEAKSAERTSGVDQTWRSSLERVSVTEYTEGY